MTDTRSIWVKLAPAAALGLVLLAAGARAQPAVSPALSPPALEVPALPLTAPSVVPTDRAISLREAIAIAMYYQPQLALAEYTASAANARVSQAVSGYYPSGTVSGQHTRTGPSRAGGVSAVGGQFTAGGYTANFSARELIYDFGKTPSAVGQARRQAESALESLAQTRQDTVIQVKQAYYALLQDQQLAEVQQRNVSDQQAHLDLTKARFSAGVAPRSDVVTAEAAVAEAQLNLATAQNTSAVARVNLNLAMGVDVRTPTRVEETAEPVVPLPEPAALLEQAFAQRPAVRQARATVQAARDTLGSARASNRPGFFANWNYGLSGAAFPPDRASWAYGVSLQWPLLDLGLTRGRIQEAEVNALAAEVQLRQTEQSVASEVVQAYLNVQTSRQKVTTSQAEEASAEESLALATGRYQAGVAVYIEVIDAETAAVTARTNLVNARYGLSTSLAALKAALGLEEGD